MSMSMESVNVPDSTKIRTCGTFYLAGQNDGQMWEIDQECRAGDGGGG
jgi:hypothetical protein